MVVHSYRYCPKHTKCMLFHLPSLPTKAYRKNVISPNVFWLNLYDITTQRRTTCTTVTKTNILHTLSLSFIVLYGFCQKVDF